MKQLKMDNGKAKQEHVTQGREILTIHPSLQKCIVTEDQEQVE